MKIIKVRVKGWEMVGEGKQPKENKKVKILKDSERDELVLKREFKNKILKEVLKDEIKAAKIKIAELKNG